MEVQAISCCPTHLACCTDSQNTKLRNYKVTELENVPPWGEPLLGNPRSCDGQTAIAAFQTVTDGTAVELWEDPPHASTVLPKRDFALYLPPEPGSPHPKHPLWRFRYAVPQAKLNMFATAVSLLGAALIPAQAPRHGAYRLHNGLWPCRPDHTSRHRQAADQLRHAFDRAGGKIVRKVMDLDFDLAVSMKHAHRSTRPATFRNTDVRYGALGTAVSVHPGCEHWHRDSGASPAYPFVIFAIKPAKLYVRLPGERATVFLMEPGDAVGIVSSAYEHRVEEDAERSCMWPGPFSVFTAWNWQRPTTPMQEPR